MTLIVAVSHNDMCGFGFIMLLVIASKPLFSLGKVFLTPATKAMFSEGILDVNELINRHISGDWSDMCDDDIESNKDAIVHGFRVFSSYKLSESQNIWIITEADRSCTTLLLPDEY